MEDIKTKFRSMLEPVRFSPSSIITRPSTDPRTPFESDYSRVLLSAPVRRLQDKAQVFPLADNDYVRTRLTHSMEVSRFAKDMGRGIEEILGRLDMLSYTVYKDRWISSILETVGLIHDIGNPPFGHASERCIQEFFRNLLQPNDVPDAAKEAYKLLTPRQRRDFEFFDGNVQGFRILRHLGILPFNLTMPTLSTIIKYPYDSVTGNQPKEQAINHMQEKYGYYDNDVEDYVRICTTLGLKQGQRHPLTFVLEAADDIAYLVCDIEDGAKIGNFTISKIQEVFKEYRCEDWLSNNMRDIPNGEKYMYKLRISMQSQMLNACVEEFIHNFEDIVEGKYNSELLSASKMGQYKPIFRALDKLNFQSKSAHQKESEGVNAIRYLLHYYVNLLFSDEHLDPHTFIMDEFSENYWKAACAEGHDVPTEPYQKFMLITDYISGMTDSYALQAYKELLT